MTVRVVTVGYGAAALAALRMAVAELKSVDPMAPVTVIAPNNIAGIVARRHLAAGIDGNPGIAGIDVTTLARLADRIATPLLAPRRPATRTVLAAAWRRVLAENPGRFRNIADHPATVRALVSAHAELRDLTDAARAAVRDTTPVSHDLVVRHEAVARRLAGEWFDATDILTTAAERVDATALGACILYLPGSQPRRGPGRDRARRCGRAHRHRRVHRGQAGRRGDRSHPHTAGRRAGGGAEQTDGQPGDQRL